jgi:hypothetical protein
MHSEVITHLILMILRARMWLYLIFLFIISHIVSIQDLIALEKDHVIQFKQSSYGKQAYNPQVHEVETCEYVVWYRNRQGKVMLVCVTMNVKGCLECGDI